MLEYRTAGESHGRCLSAFVEGFPSGFPVDVKAINDELKRRQGGYGRGKRQSLEQDTVEFMSGVWNDVTIGSPIHLQINNQDFKLPRLQELPRPRPGHGDLTGAMKYLGSIRGILERASARETAARVAAGALAAQLLKWFNIEVFGFVTEIGGEQIPIPSELKPSDRRAERNRSEIFSLDSTQDQRIKDAIDAARNDGDTLGGLIEVWAEGVPFGLGSHAQWNQKLDGRIAQAVMSVQAIKGVEIGMGFEVARHRGSQVHDPIHFDVQQRSASHLGFVRPTNNAGGIEAGMSNGQPIVVRAALKPISTLQKPLDSIDLATKQPSGASYERSDICAVPAASVILENVVAFEVASAMVEKFGGDSLGEMQSRFEMFQNLARQR